MSTKRDPESINRPLLVAGLLIVVASIGMAAWMFRLGDIVTALGLGLLIIAGLLLTGIGFSPETATH
ncbi:hypothetical protein [Natronomonas sp.]|uniref:hypothetical protein n=1 Tax=Natronomonas sp. TaxID=2184060 RepID=UPI002FC3C527